MELFSFLLVFVFGSIIGSFLNVVIDQSNEGKLFEKRRSHCDHCRHKLSAADLIPILSFFMLGGKCRYCGKSISPYYPTVEFITGSVFVFVTFLLLGDGLQLLNDTRYLLAVVYYLFIMASLIVIFFADLKYGIIPFPAVVGAVFFTVVWYLLLPHLHFFSGELPFMENYFLTYFLSGIGAFLFFFILFFVTKGRGMGFGDVIYAFLMGFLLGFPKIILSLYFAFIVGALISLLLVILRRKRLKGSTIPFGPFLVMGTVVSMFWGEYLIEKVLFFLVR